MKEERINARLHERPQTCSMYRTKDCINALRPIPQITISWKDISAVYYRSLDLRAKHLYHSLSPLSSLARTLKLAHAVALSRTVEQGFCHSTAAFPLPR